MCGICGIFGEHDPERIVPMMRSLQHRGPDDQGTFRHRNLLSLGHKRLSIIDLSTGRQPITNESGSVTVVFNGEIYNYIELRRTLQKRGHLFRTSSDTEVLVHLYEDHGPRFLEYLNGEFAIALFDSEKETLFLIRDRLGIRPLYLHHKNGRWIFASEIKALLASGYVDRRLDPVAFNDYLTLRYVPGSRTVFDGITRLPPASLLTLTNRSARLSRWWDPPYSDPPLQSPSQEESLIQEFRFLLEDSVRLRLRSDVPVGAFLSGGLDSSSVVALTRRYADHLSTFSVGFRTSIDETTEAETMARFLEADHTSFFVEPEDYRLLPEIVRGMDEPIGDFIILPIFLLARHASEKVKVVLTGEGIDEILGGYIHHVLLTRLWRAWPLTASLPARAASLLLRALPTPLLERAFPYPGRLGDDGRRRAALLFQALNSFPHAYLAFAGLFSPKERSHLLGTDLPRESSVERLLATFHSDRHRAFSLNRLIDFDVNHWLADYTLLKQDRLTMLNSIEGRVPFLDHRLVEFCARLPHRLKLRAGQTKSILRRAMRGIVPEDTRLRKKKAFYIPTGETFGEDFLDFAREILTDREICDLGLFNKKALEQLLADATRPGMLPQKRLNTVLIAALWARESGIGVRNS